MRGLPIGETLLVKRVPSAATWQPIDTAPKDGTEILTSDGSEYYLTAWEDGAWGMPDSMVYTPKLTHWTALLPLPESAKS